MNKTSNAQANAKRVRLSTPLGSWWALRYPTRRKYHHSNDSVCFTVLTPALY
jgi:hypothetical protein